MCWITSAGLCCWQGILADKDSVILELKQQVKNLREDLNMANIDSDRKSVALLTKVYLYLFINFIYVWIYALSDAKKLRFMICKYESISSD